MSSQTDAKKPDTIPGGKHGDPEAGLECVVCFCEIDDSTYCEYKTHDGSFIHCLV